MISHLLRLRLFVSGTIILLSCVATSNAENLNPSEIAQSVAKIQQIGKEGTGHRAASEAADRLRHLSNDQVFIVLQAMKPRKAIANNWLRGIASDIVSRSGMPKSALLTEFLSNTKFSPPGRAMAFSLWRQADVQAANVWVVEQLDDPSLLIREAAVHQALSKVPADDDSEQTKTMVRKILGSARHPKQVNEAIKKLEKLGDSVTQADAFSMVTKWQSIGPFDNRNGIGFDTIFPPEANFAANGEVNLQASYEGKLGPDADAVAWQEVVSTSDEGLVDLAATYNKEKGAVSYVYAEFDSPTAQDAQARLGCICANKVWLNGEEIMSNEVYHSGTMVDQYIANCQLKSGKNRILMKICQNEQTEPWAQEWDFRFRLTDLTGKGLSPGSAGQMPKVSATSATN